MPASYKTQLQKTVIAPGGHRSGIVHRGQILRLTDLEGTQAVDFLCYNADDPLERYSATDTIKIAGRIFVGKGSLLYSDMGNVLFTVIEDTCGRHDTIAGCCSIFVSLMSTAVSRKKSRMFTGPPRRAVSWDLF